MKRDNRKHYVRHREVKAYFTVEAAMVFPIVLAVQVLLIYLLFFQYNRCLMEQDAGVLSVRSSTLGEEDDWMLLERMQGEAEKLYQEKYIGWEFHSPTLEVKRNRIRIRQEGQQIFHFANTEWQVGNGWSTDIAYDTQRISPMTFVRSWRKITGGE